LKYEEVYLKAYETIKQAELEIGHYFVFYNLSFGVQKGQQKTPNLLF
jgi:putative transposase